MPSQELPKRAGFAGPRGPVRCDVPTDVIGQYLEALEAWVPPVRPGGGVSCPPSPVPMTSTEAVQ